ncbi:MAG: hypothetical protein WC026_13320 [Hyphomicrobium sp.]|uniref:hypothetical protein n=1 Tax=Hyphomicrobium sp. TaxID=82 RepID=UPI003564F80D
MSLKAYDGLMTTKGFPYIQKEIQKRIGRLREASENQVAKEYAHLITKHADRNESEKSVIIDSLLFRVINDDETFAEKIKKIDTEKYPILSVLFQGAKILSETNFINEFTVHLNISLEVKAKRILMNPNCLVHGHRKILLECFQDWYAQDGEDADENVPKREWEMRCKDWYEFHENFDFTTQIKIFDPKDYKNSVIPNFRGEKLTNAILSHIPSDEKRIKDIVKRKLIGNRKTQSLSDYIKKDNYLDSEEGKIEIETYIKENPIQLTKIDLDYLNNEKV